MDMKQIYQPIQHRLIITSKVTEIAFKSNVESGRATHEAHFQEKQLT